MKSLLVKLGVTLFVIEFAIFSNIEVWAADWKLYAASADYSITHYYDGEV
jgi:hypothetical protein